MQNVKKIKKIINQVPPDYYQRGIDKNILQRLWHTGKLNSVLSMIKNKPETILDIGCASGWFLSKIADKYLEANCFGIDVYNKAIQYGKKHYKNLHLRRGNAHKLPYKSKSFDLILCTEVLEHVENPDIVLKEMRRVLKPNGLSLIEMDSGNLLFKLVWYWWNDMRKGVWKDAHLHEFDSKKLEKIIKKEFCIDKKKTFNFKMAVVFRVY